MDEDVPELDTAGLLAAVSGAVRARRRAEVAEMELVAQWAVVHSEEPADRWDCLVQVGGEGTPLVREFCLGELALARETGATAAGSVLADTLDLLHRLPSIWGVCLQGRADLSVARRVAKLTRHLPAEAVGLVDAAVAAVIGREAAGRVLAVAEAKIIEADPALHQARAEAEARRRYVSSTKTDKYGLRTVIARVEAGDALWVEATVARVAEILAPRFPDASADELRSIAFGWLARPAELLQLLLEHQEPQEELEPEPSRATAFPADLLDALPTVDLTPLAPKTVLYVHLHEAALTGVPTVARAEGLGPLSLTALRSLLARTRLTIRPVIDLADRIRSTAYEHPEALKERVHLTTNGDYWPYAVSTSRHVDYDHPTNHHSTGPPGHHTGQTGSHNSGPLGRRHHRWKTHAGYRARQCGAGRYIWLTPHGLGFLVDHRGTHPITAGEAQLILNAPPDVDIYPT